MNRTCKFCGTLLKDQIYKPWLEKRALQTKSMENTFNKILPE